MSLFILTPQILFAQNDGWTEETTRGKTHVKYLLSNSIDANGDERLIVKYVATKTVTLDLRKAAAFLNKGANYKLFLEHVEETKTVSTVTDNEWILYQYISPPWPMPDADCVQRVTTKFVGDNELVVDYKAVPNAYKMGDVTRMDLSIMQFHFKVIDGKKVRITFTNHFAPVGSIPKVLMSTWFPQGPEGIIDRLVEQINKS